MTSRLDSVDLAPLHRGGSLLKFTRKGIPLERDFSLSEDNRYLSWNSSFWAFKNNAEKRIDMTTVRRIQRGHLSAMFERVKLNFPGTEERAFSIVYGEDQRTLDLIAQSMQEFEIWFHGLQEVVRAFIASTDQRPGQSDDLFLRRKFEESDKNSNKVLSKREVFSLLHSINLNMPSKALEALFQKVDTDNSGDLNFEEFSEFIRILRRRGYIEYLWELLVSRRMDNFKHVTNFNLAKADKGLDKSLIPQDVLNRKVSVHDFMHFWNFFQGRSITEAEAVAKIQSASPATEDELKDPNHLTYPQFLAIMDTQDNSVYDSNDLKMNANMFNEPLSMYYIASSHNTYLSGDQLTGTASVDRYVDVLMAGCRCVEIDVWDGEVEDGDSMRVSRPVVTHGNTLTTKILFEDVIQAIKDHAFLSNSNEPNEMPIILSLENHCCLEMQKMMADIMKNIFGDAILMPGTGIRNGKMPSPNELRRKIIIKGKVNNIYTVEKADADSEESEEEVKRDEQHPQSPVAFGLQKEDKSDSAPKIVGVIQGAVASRQQGEKAPKLKIHPDLVAITYLRATHIKDFSKSDQLSCDLMCSYRETKVEKYLRNPDILRAWISHNANHLSRTYPSGCRIDCSNMDSLPSWPAGNQLVALNYQSEGVPMFLNHGKFLQNGSCGYVLKPFYMRSPYERPLPPRTIKIHVIGGNLLPKPNNSGVTIILNRGEIIDPYVRINMCGVEADNAEYRTRTVDDNGFNPVWDEVFTFKVTNPECAQVLFRVMDADLDRDDFVAFSSIPVLSLLEGFRRVLLYDKSGTRGGDMVYASLFVRIGIAY